MKFREAKLEMKTSVISFKDNIKNYKGKKLMNLPMPGTAENQTKKHPFEELITSNIVKTASEDILDGLWSAEYDITDRTPQGCFDGYDTLIDDMITATEIAAGEGNLVATGEIVTPANDTDYNAINKLVAFVRSSSHFLKRMGVLYVTKNVYQFAVDALELKFKYKDWGLNDVQRYINEKAGAKVTLIPNDFMGTGDRILLTIPGNLHFGMDTFGDEEFVEVRTPYEDPNAMQFWLQADFGCRIVSIHKKEFQVNDRSGVGASIGGDYVS